MWKLLQRTLFPCLAAMVAGCMYPYSGPGYVAPGYPSSGYPTQPPMYGPQMGPGAPGTIVVPPSSAPPYIPGGSTYEGTDDFRSRGSGTSEDGQYYPNEDTGVPDPQDPGTRNDGMFKGDLESGK